MKNKIMLIFILLNLTAMAYCFQEALVIKRLSSPLRSEIIDSNKIIKAMLIKPGMTIVDIGAGIGTYTFPIAAELRGNGIVYATEIKPDLLEIIDQKKRKLGLNTIQTVLVTTNGLDLFYNQHTFDIIFMCSVLPYLSNPLKYLRDIKPSLRRNTGRLYIISARKTSSYFDPELTDQKIIILLNTTDNQKLSRKLSKNYQNYLARLYKHGALSENYQMPEKYRRILICDLKRILSNNEMYLNDRTVLDAGPLPRRYLNRTNIVKASLTSLLYNNLIRLQGETGFKRSIAGEKELNMDLIKALVELAGYKFVCSHTDDTLVKGRYYFLEFKR